MACLYRGKEYIVIQPWEIAKIEKPELGEFGRETEEQYRELVKNSQEYFKWYVRTKSDAPYYLNEEIDCAYLYLDIAHAITVGKMRNAKYGICSTGRHRLYVARKYRMPLLVCCQSKAEKLSIIGKIRSILYKKKYISVIKGVLC